MIYKKDTRTTIILHTDGLYYATYAGTYGITKGCGQTPEEAEQAAVRYGKQTNKPGKFPKRRISGLTK